MSRKVSQLPKRWSGLTSIRLERVEVNAFHPDVRANRDTHWFSALT